MEKSCFIQKWKSDFEFRTIFNSIISFGITVLFEKVPRSYIAVRIWVAVQTKSDRILQDIDLLDEINQKTKCVVQLTLILSFINDTEESIKAILDEYIRMGVKGIICFNMGLTLRDDICKGYKGRTIRER
ncbi:hypothetical protein [Velocimicrobium porci]|uniref:hypothetical protein n=1 Tax=Velocimicrobium porci TaxID=2606634 RepID=UPI002F428335